MYQIVEKKVLNEQVKLFRVKAPHVAKKAKPGQFIVLRVSDDGERIPLTIADYDREEGTITIIFQEVGATTAALGLLNEGDYIHDFAGPLGLASELEGIKKACVIGGGLGCAIAYPQAKALHNLGAKVDIIAGFRNKDIIILEDEMKAVCENLIICTDDGSNGRKNLVTNELEALLQAGEQYDVVIAIGPLVMMKFVCLTTKKYNVKTIVSMNPIMVDGTGMCGGCRLTVGGETKFACVDGPDFDGHLVDFDETIRRSKMYKKFEQEAMERHRCNLEEVINNA
ncbi:MAG: sulfide/dihydroorotate dehydrogenase-like FAD/NAD-binding protein [Clostridia bacterium]|jgi:ferredoxin--NADP+ reductase|nr:sulfide/dihydroorotate dehydrogenase-like FAD/NAD-binding protein [Clostridia bacterium]MBQ1434581.1 sulfide/dihydroorotate dehydrogenase-like FAD/NAD-binding protein [Clostridia bacterium]MBQ4248571.1 sulfide/dihydroorotate dehydrogenase-like FAD/NAD-binding protein [Clostridia bacterium]